jgi:hypothetical protein
MTKPVILVSYWPPAVVEPMSEGAFVRFTSHEPAADLARQQGDRRVSGPSASVWMVPATNPEDPDYERSPALERHARISGSQFWLGQVPVTRHYSIGSFGDPGYVMFSYFSFHDGALSIGQCETVPVADLPVVLAAHHANGRTRAGYKYVNGRPVLTDDMHR